MLQNKRLRDIALQIHEIYIKVYLQAFWSKCAKNLALYSK